MKFYKVSEERLSQLLKFEDQLGCLESGGVDNWDWYGDSLREHWDNFDGRLPVMLADYERV